MEDSTQKKVRLKPKERAFLEKLGELKDLGDAYLAAGYKAKSREIAQMNGSRLNRRLCKTMPHKEIGEQIIATSRIYQRTKELMDQEKDLKAAVKATELGAALKGMKETGPPSTAGIQIAIIQRLPGDTEHGRIDATQETINISEGSKPLALRD